MLLMHLPVCLPVCLPACLSCVNLLQVAAHEARRADGSKAAADKGKGKAPAGLSSGPFYSELEAEVRHFLYICMRFASNNGAACCCSGRGTGWDLLVNMLFF
jgi:hypothetical protein